MARMRCHYPWAMAQYEKGPRTQRMTHRLLHLAASLALLFTPLLAQAQEEPETSPTVEEDSAPTRPAGPPTEAISPPAGTESLDASWIRIGSDRGTFLAAVARPESEEPAPLVLVLHGSHGFAQNYVRVAQDLAAAGYVAVAPCWFAGTAGGPPPAPAIACPEAPAPPPGMSRDAVQIVAALLAAALNLPGVLPDRVAIFGHSRGAGAAIGYASGLGGIRAVALSGGGYPAQAINTLASISASVLVLHATNDSPATGGTPDTNVRNAQAFEAAMTARGGTVEAHYADGAGHNDIWLKSSQYGEWLQYLQSFLDRHL